MESSSVVSVLVLVLTAIVPVYLFCVPKDPYGAFHLSLNKLPGEDIHSPPKTEWLNQGYWKDTKVFPQACRALALGLIRGQKEGERILDVGHGTGESLLIHLKDPAVPRPSSVTGITSLQSHYERTRERIQRQLSPSSKIPVNLYHGDAICRRDLDLDHPLCPSHPATFDSIYALDCAYHFVTRKNFLYQAYQKLSPGGRVALADICFSTEGLQSRKIKIATRCWGIMPKENMVSPEEYVDNMAQIGYVDITLEDVTDHVFPGVIEFFRNRGWGWWCYGCFLQWYTRSGRVRFVILKGIKSVVN